MSPQPMKLLGVEKVMANLNKEIRKIKNYSVQGLIESAYVIFRDMDSVPPTIPIDQGNLRASRFSTVGTGNKVQDSGSFEGPDAGKLSSDHAAIVSSASAQAGSARNTNRPILIMGFSASYAPFVEGWKGPAVWKRPGSGPRFFESALKRNEKVILTLIAESAKRS